MKDRQLGGPSFPRVDFFPTACRLSTDSKETDSNPKTRGLALKYPTKQTAAENILKLTKLHARNMSVIKKSKQIGRRIVEDYQHSKENYDKHKGVVYEQHIHKVVDTLTKQVKNMGEKHIKEAKRHQLNYQNQVKRVEQYRRQVFKSEANKMTMSTIKKTYQPLCFIRDRSSEVQTRKGEAMNQISRDSTILLKNTMLKLNEANCRRRQTIERKSASLSDRNQRYSSKAETLHLNISSAMERKLLAKSIRKIELHETLFKVLSDRSRVSVSGRREVEARELAEAVRRRDDKEAKAGLQRELALEESLKKIAEVNRKREQRLEGVSQELSLRRSKALESLHERHSSRMEDYRKNCSVLLVRDQEKSRAVKTLLKSKEDMVRRHLYQSQQLNLRG